MPQNRRSRSIRGGMATAAAANWRAWMIMSKRWCARRTTGSWHSNLQHGWYGWPLAWNKVMMFCSLRLLYWLAGGRAWTYRLWRLRRICSRTLTPVRNSYFRSRHLSCGEHGLVLVVIRGVSYSSWTGASWKGSTEQDQLNQDMMWRWRLHLLCL
jgi:hypothetical protein